MIRPLNDRVVVEPIEQDGQTPSGILLPDMAKRRPERGVVLAVGPGLMGPDGNRIEMQVKPGDRVWFTRFTGDYMVVDGLKLAFMREGEIMAKE